MTFGEVRFQLSKRCPGTDADILDGFINDAYQSILAKKAWKGLEADSVIATQATYAVGTIALTAGAVAVVGSGTTFTAAMDGAGVYIPGRNESYRFTFVDATHGALDRFYEGSTAAAAGYTLYQDIYDLPSDYARPSISLNPRLPGEIVLSDRGVLSRLLPLRLVFGEPQMYSIVSDSAEDLKRAQLYPIPNYAAGYPFTYIRSAPVLTEGDTAVPILPWVSTKALIDLTRAAIEADNKNYAGAKVYIATAQVEIDKMLLADAKQRGPQRIRMARKYTRYRVEQCR